MPVADLGTLEHKLGKRGFRRDDVYFHVCDTCTVQAVVKYVIIGRTGGRDIWLCHDCGAGRSWRYDPGMNEREEDIGFDLRAFLG